VADIAQHLLAILCFFAQNGYGIYDDVNRRKIPGLEQFAGLVDIEKPVPLTFAEQYALTEATAELACACYAGVLLLQAIGLVAALGLDETSFLKATRVTPTRWVTGPVDLERGRLLDVVADRTRAAVDGWLGGRPVAWLARIATVALDPGAGTPAPWSPRLATPGWWWTTSTPSGWPTWWSTRSAVACSRPPSGIGAAR
jgi:hypothetical protein